MKNRQIMDKIRVNIDNYFNGLSPNEKFSGSILVSINGEKVVSKGYGMANYEFEIPNISKTKFRIGSVTKQFTSVAILQLCEKGLINLNNTLDTFIPDYPKGNKVTIHHLLSHTSGITNYTNAKDILQIIRNKHSVDELYIGNNKLFKGEILNEYSLNKMMSKHAQNDKCYYGYGLLFT